MESGALGKEYTNGMNIINEGEIGNCMYVIQAGRVAVLQERDGKEIQLAELGEGEFFGEMSIFEQEVRSATVRAIDNVRVLTIDKKNFLRRIHEDPSLAFHLVKNMSHRIRELNVKHSRIQAKDRRDWNTRPDNI
jgi:CRP-like cAMP-binding protein